MLTVQCMIDTYKHNILYLKNVTHINTLRSKTRFAQTHFNRAQII